MALTPFLAQLGGRLGKLLEKNDMKALQVLRGWRVWGMVEEGGMNALQAPRTGLGSACVRA